MPTVHFIENRNISIIISPMKECQLQHGAPLVGAETDAYGHTQDDRESSPPNGDGQEILFAQWDALVEREGRDAYRHDLSDALQLQDFEESRETVSSWCFHWVDQYDIDRSIVSVALSYHDRLVSNGFVDATKKREWMLAAFSCLQLATKVASSPGKTCSLKDLVTLSNGFFVEEDFADMEYHICHVFDWYLNPPVASNFIDIITPLLLMHAVSEYDYQVGGEVVEQSRYLCERSVLDIFFSGMSPSSVAYAAVLVALDIMRFPVETIKWFEFLALDHDPEETHLCMQRLHLICSEEGHRPRFVFHYCPDQTPGGMRAVTPTKDDDAFSSIKRVRQETICGEEKEEAIVALSAKKRKVTA